MAKNCEVKIKMPMPCSKPQKQFFSADCRYVAYGGARGGGKTWAARRKAELLALEIGGIKILILRRTFPQLQKNFIEEMKMELAGSAIYNEAKKRWVFPNNSRIDFGYCAAENDVDQYQGSEYDVIFMDEATHFTESQFIKLDACIRGANNYPKRFYLTCNPGGVGHAWVKRRFISKNYRLAEKPEDHVFIPAKLQDNTVLMKKDPQYKERLESLPPELRRAWLDGDWDVLSGQYFSEWRREAHVVKTVQIAANWRRYYALDYGLDMLAGYAIAVDEEGFALVYSELYQGRENGGGTNGGGLLVSEAAECVRRATQGQNIEAFFAPPDLWNRRQDTGRSVAEVFAQQGIPLVKVDNRRVQGWLELKQWLKPAKRNDGKKTPRLQVAECCENLIESMPSLVYSVASPNDCSTQPHGFTHAPDALRYFVSGRPMAGHRQGEEGGFEPAEDYDIFLGFGV